MKLQCSVRIHNRLLSQLSMNASTKYKKAVISVVKPSKTSEIFLAVVTQNDRAGSRYKIHGNVEKIFGQFCDQGKCTIRFKEPCHDLCINADQISLKNFLMYMKKMGKGEPGANQNISKQVPQCKTVCYKLEIKAKEDYPVLKGFPSTLQTLAINDCKLIKFDTRILKLKNLTTLSLSKNKIKSIPVELGTLHLKELFVDGNDLKNETWLFLSGAIHKTLKFLNISGNEMKHIPPSLSRVHSLRVLKASRNLLTSIPFRICLLPQLMELDISYNNIMALPGTIKRRNLKKLDVLDVSGNEILCQMSDAYAFMSSVLLKRENHSSLLSLLELSGQQIINSRLPYNEETLPYELVRLLDNAGQCSCGKTTVKTRGVLRYSIDPKSIANTFVSTERQQNIPVVFSSCCSKYSST